MADDHPPVVTRFAPSPTGYLHIGGARTALFNWLFARGRGGKFLLRIEDTDRARSTPEATAAILSGLTWLGLDWDGDPTSQFDAKDRHAEVAYQMLAEGTGYKCFSTPDEITAFREAAQAEGRSSLFLSPWRDTPSDQHPNAPFVVRLRAPREGKITINDAVQGAVTWQNETLDDMVLLRSDGTPTYMLAVVVDDHDMGVTHVIRGDDHLANAARQAHLYLAMNWPLPIFAHIPLIHGPDGKKLSKRHGALGVEEYAAMGYPPSAMRNYLSRLGWSHGNDELFDDEQALEWFSLDGIGKSPARLDFKKLDSVSAHHIAKMPDTDLLVAIEQFLAVSTNEPLSQLQKDGLITGMYCLKERAKTLPELLLKAHFVLSSRPFTPDLSSQQLLDDVSRGILTELTPHLQTVSWTRDMLEATVSQLAETHGLKLGKLAQPLRAALAGRTVSPSVFDMMLVIGRVETLARLNDAARLAANQTD
ncbi:MAG: glutamyl-tRNA synthetase [Paracoccaceae bacterium]|jgi:glutamyl-tRNA synthetase